MPPAPESGGERPLALGAGVSAYVLWGLIPLAFQVLGRMGVSPWEILAHRTVWAAPTALLFVWMARQGAQVRAVMFQRRTMAWLALSAALLSINWSTFIWAVNSGRVLESSLGYYINPLLNMAAGAFLFRERLSRLALLAIGLASVGVLLQTLALGHLPWVSLLLGFSFCAYGVVRKRVAADAQTGLFIECLFLAAPSVAYIAWLQAQGGSTAHGTAAHLWLVACGPLTALPLMLFSWAARRIPFSVMGFLQFIAPTMTFFIGLAQGEAFTPLRALSFVFIWCGAAVFVLGALRAARLAAAHSAA